MRRLWKKALWHSVKYLFRRHPLAALSAAGAGAAFAGKEVVKEGQDYLREKMTPPPEPCAEAGVVPEAARDAEETPMPAVAVPQAQADAEAEKVVMPDPEMDEEERAAFWNSLSPQARRTLEALAASRRQTP